MKSTLHYLRGTVKAAALLVAISVPASAQISFAGSTQFNFDGGAYTSLLNMAYVCPQGMLTCTTAQKVPGMVVTGKSFNVNTVVTNPLLPLWSYANIGSQITPNNSLGLVKLFDRNYNYAGHTIGMLVTLISPSAPLQTFTSTLTGVITNCRLCHPNQDVYIAWSNNGNVPFTGGMPGMQTGVFDLNVDDTDVILGPQTRVVTGNVAVHATPEPASLALLGTGFVGIFGAARLRRKKA